MSTRLVILGLLRERPLHGYEIKSLIEEQMGDWTNIAFGSIYFALGKLAEEGFIENTSTEQKGNRPSRSIYSITDTGRDEFLHLLRKVWQTPERKFYPLDIGLFFMEALPHQELVKLISGRITYLNQALKYVQEHRQQTLAQDEIPSLAKMIFDHSLQHLVAEQAWLQEVLTTVENDIF